MIMRVSFGFVAALLLSGCAAPPAAFVTGDVRLDGKPLAEGQVRFVPTDGTEGAAIAADIRDGAFALDAIPPGTYLLQVYAPKKTGKTVTRPDLTPGRSGGGAEEEFVETIPPTYNVRSTLKKKLSAGDNIVNLELASRPLARRSE